MQIVVRERDRARTDLFSSLTKLEILVNIVLFTITNDVRRRTNILFVFLRATKLFI